MITLKKKLIYENYFSRKSMDSCPFNLVMEEGIVTKILVRPEGKFSKLYFSKAYSSPSFINFPPLKTFVKERCGLFSSMVDHDLCWFSKRCKKKSRRSLYLKKKEKSVSFLKYIYIYIDHFDLSLDEKLVRDNPREKR